MISIPLVSVVLPVFNASETIHDAIDSILKQSYANFELIIINDGSTDSSDAVIRSFSDERILYLKNESNRGLIYTLNRGLSSSKGKYIARMDADDISCPDRFQKQVDVLESNPSIIVCGTKIKTFGMRKATFSLQLPESSKAIKERLLLEVPFAHPTVMIRREVLLAYNLSYDIHYPSSEDYKFWVDLSSYGEFYNIQEPLLNYRISATQVSSSTKSRQIDSSVKCRRLYLQKMLGHIDLPDTVTLSTIQSLKPYFSSNKYLLPILYLSLERYTLTTFFQFVFSFAWLHFDSTLLARFLSRFIFKKSKLL